MKILALFFLLAFSGNSVNIYSIVLPSIENGQINLNDFKNKNILIVNTGSGSRSTGQLIELQRLYTLHHDSLVVIALPSNSFGSEPRDNVGIRTFMESTYGITFPIVAKSEVHGIEANDLSKWLSFKMQNDMMNAPTNMDFEKYLVSPKGKLIGVFDSSIHAFDPAILGALE